MYHLISQFVKSSWSHSTQSQNMGKILYIFCDLIIDSFLNFSANMPTTGKGANWSIKLPATAGRSQQTSFFMRASPSSACVSLQFSVV